PLRGRDTPSRPRGQGRRENDPRGAPPLAPASGPRSPVSGRRSVFPVPRFSRSQATPLPSGVSPPESPAPSLPPPRASDALPVPQRKQGPGERPANRPLARAPLRPRRRPESRLESAYR